MSNDAIYIEKLDVGQLVIPIVGTAPLIMNKFPEKAKQELIARDKGKKKQTKVRDYHAEYESSFHRIENEDGLDGYGFPAIAFKAATVGGARYYGKAIPMTQLRQFIFFHGVLTPADLQQLVPIEGEPRMREDIVRLSGPGRSPAVRYRAEFLEWSAELRVDYIRSSISKDSVLSLIDAGGFGVGVGEWRPEKNGDFGTYTIDEGREVLELS